MFLFRLQNTKYFIFSVVRSLNKVQWHVLFYLSNNYRQFTRVSRSVHNEYMYLYYILSESPLLVFLDLICFLFNFHPEQRRMSKTIVAIANIAKKTYVNVVFVPSLQKTLPILHFYFLVYSC